ncbi:hypothetical protein KFZ76_08120 [Methylovulum psychrotolerans]|uniref:hypothetical protein n=1 Tax=Methylovulum psychrotolerans TaxID=1704499 RepID=UPI001BFF5F14|nr:hypothetical protein [Methylovulum psychrotolerans]MBT9097671.1 hypothetical protein [Methylovulum psychrotolerans]
MQTFTYELRCPATTNAQRMAVEMAKRYDIHHISVVFFTYFIPLGLILAYQLYFLQSIAIKQ